MGWPSFSSRLAPISGLWNPSSSLQSFTSSNPLDLPPISALAPCPGFLPLWTDKQHPIRAQPSSHFTRFSAEGSCLSSAPACPVHRRLAGQRWSPLIQCPPGSPISHALCPLVTWPPQPALSSSSSPWCQMNLHTGPQSRKPLRSQARSSNLSLFLLPGMPASSESRVRVSVSPTQLKRITWENH